MPRTAILVGKTESGDLLAIELAEGQRINELLATREKLRASGGLLRKRNAEVKLTEVLCLANHTAGGELKAALKFQ